jgi:thiol-disulfide isomerase/thioredoxin
MTDLEAALDSLVEAGVVVERSDGLVTDESFESTRRIYRDTYGDADTERLTRTVADAFGVDTETARERVTSGDVTREELVAYLSLGSHLDGVDDEELAAMATVLAEIGSGSPVPEAVAELDDEAWPAFLDANPDAVVTVWRHDCVPCEALKEDLDEVLDAVPSGVAVAGIDGTDAPDFRRAFDVDTAPAICGFRDGDLRGTVTGRQSPAAYAERFDEWY